MSADNPLSWFLDAAKTTVGGVLAFFAGLMGGVLIVYSENLVSTGSWGWCAVAWIVLIPYTVMKGWGLLLVPALGVIFYGSIWREWSRLMVASGVAILLASTLLLCARYNPFTQDDSPMPFAISMGITIAIFALGLVLEARKRQPAKTMATKST